MRSRSKRPASRVLVIQLATVAVLLAVWQLMSWLGVGLRELFPSLPAIALSLWQIISDGELGPHLLTSGYEVGLGFVLGSVPAVLLGLLAGMQEYVRRVFEPLILYFAAVPFIIVFPIFILAFGIGPNSKVAMAAASAFFPTVITTMAAVFSVRPVHLKVGRSLRLSGVKLLGYVYLPAMAPGILLGLRLGMGVAIVGALLAETKAANSGLGFLVTDAYNRFQIPRMYALLVLIFILAAAINWLMTLLSGWSAATRSKSNVTGFLV